MFDNAAIRRARLSGLQFGFGAKAPRSASASPPLPAFFTQIVGSGTDSRAVRSIHFIRGVSAGGVGSGLRFSGQAGRERKAGSRASGDNRNAPQLRRSSRGRGDRVGTRWRGWRARCPMRTDPGFARDRGTGFFGTGPRSPDDPPTTRRGDDALDDDGGEDGRMRIS